MTELHTPTEPGQSVTDYSTNQPLHIHQELCLPENENRDINGNTVGSETMESRNEEEREITGGESIVDVTMEEGKVRKEEKKVTIETEQTSTEKNQRTKQAREK